MDAVTHDPNCPILHGCSFAWNAMFGTRGWRRQEEGGLELEGKVDVGIARIADH